jgi:hypothetical protein
MWRAIRPDRPTSILLNAKQPSACSLLPLHITESGIRFQPGKYGLAENMDWHEGCGIHVPQKPNESKQCMDIRAVYHWWRLHHVDIQATPQSCAIGAVHVLEVQKGEARHNGKAVLQHH